MKIYIYSYINKINGHRYIGKTNNVERRKREHYSHAYNPNSSYYNSLWMSKIRQYGYENFDFEILEITDDAHWVEKEKYWIDYYNTFKGAGYNSTEGGDDGDMEPLLNDNEIRNIIDLLQNSNLTQEQIANKIGISGALLSNINQGKIYIQQGINYPIRKNYKRGLEDYGELIRLLKTTVKSFKDIAKELNMSESSVKKINYGKMCFDSNIDYPIRKINIFSKNEKVKDYLLNSDLSISEIAQLCSCSRRTVDRINRGETHHDDKLSYPLRP